MVGAILRQTSDYVNSAALAGGSKRPETPDDEHIEAGLVLMLFEGEDFTPRPPPSRRGRTGEATPSSSA